MRIYLTISTDNGAAFYSGLSALQNGGHIRAYTILNEDGVPMHDSDTIYEGLHTALVDLNKAILAYEHAAYTEGTHQIAKGLFTKDEL